MMIIMWFHSVVCVFIVYLLPAECFVYRDESRFHVSAGGRNGGYHGGRSYPASPYPIVTHAHSAEDAAMDAHVQYSPAGVGAPWGTVAPARLTKPPPYRYSNIPEKSYRPTPLPYPTTKSRYQPGALEAGLIPDSHKGDYGYGKYGSDERYEPGYGPVPHTGYRPYTEPTRDRPKEYRNSREYGSNRDDRYPDKRYSNSWEKPHERSGPQYGAYGPAKPSPGPWNPHPGRYDSHYYSANPRAGNLPINPWDRDPVPQGPPPPPPKTYEETKPKPLSSFHVVDTIPSRSPKDSKGSKKVTRRRKKTQKKAKAAAESDPPQGRLRALDDEGSGDLEQVYKSGGKKEDDPSMPPDCKGMKMSDPRKKMTPGMKALMCKLYKGWGKDMSEGQKWEPTQKQNDWFSSLGMKSRNGRRKRQAGTEKALRKEYRVLSDSERESFHDAMNTLKTDMVDGLSKYDLFVNSHRATNAPGAHFGAAFLPWHREMLLSTWWKSLLQHDELLSAPDPPNPTPSTPTPEKHADTNPSKTTLQDGVGVETAKTPVQTPLDDGGGVQFHAAKTRSKTPWTKPHLVESEKFKIASVQVL